MPNSPSHRTAWLRTFKPALRVARLRQTTETFRKEYGIRAGIEGTISQAVRTCDLHQSGYIGLAKTHLQHALTATAVNISRVGAWLADIPLASIRQSSFAALAPAIS